MSMYTFVCVSVCMIVYDCNKCTSKLHAVYVTVITYWIGGKGRGVCTRDHEPLRYQVTCKYIHVCIYKYMFIHVYKHINIYINEYTAISTVCLSLLLCTTTCITFADKLYNIQTNKLYTVTHIQTYTCTHL